MDQFRKFNDKIDKLHTQINLLIKLTINVQDIYNSNNKI